MNGSCLSCGGVIGNAAFDLCTVCFRAMKDQTTGLYDVGYWILKSIDVAERADVDKESLFWDTGFIEAYTDSNVPNAMLIDHIWISRIIRRVEIARTIVGM